MVNLWKKVNPILELTVNQNFYRKINLSLWLDNVVHHIEANMATKIMILKLKPALKPKHAFLLKVSRNISCIKQFCCWVGRRLCFSKFHIVIWSNFIGWFVKKGLLFEDVQPWKKWLYFDHTRSIFQRSHEIAMCGYRKALFIPVSIKSPL